MRCYHLDVSRTSTFPSISRVEDIVTNADVTSADRRGHLTVLITNIAFAILLIGFLIGLYQAAFRGGIESI